MFLREKTSRYSLLVSVIIHALILFGPVLGGKEASPNKEKSKQNKGFIPKEQKSTVVIKQKIVRMSRKKVPKPKKKKQKCENKYIGVGFTHQGLGLGMEEVIEIAPGYAADRAGLQVGDKIVGIIDHNIGHGIQPLWKLKNGKKGTLVTLVIERRGIRMELSMIREKVCEIK